MSPHPLVAGQEVFLGPSGPKSAPQSPSRETILSMTHAFSDAPPGGRTDPLAAARLLEDQADRLVALMDCSSAGVRGCFEALYDELVPHLYAVALAVLRNQAHAEEVTQEVFLEIWQKAPSYDRSKGSVKTWALTLARRRSIDRVRAVEASSQRDLAQGVKEFTSVYEHVDAAVQAHLDREELGRALADLEADQAQLLRLAYFGGLTQRELAQHLGLPLGTVKSRMRQTLLALRKTLGGNR